MAAATRLLGAVLLFASAATVAAAAAAAPLGKDEVLAAAKKALDHWSAANPPTTASCSWTDSTLMLGAIEYHKASNDTAALQGVSEWARQNQFRVCGDRQAADVALAPLSLAPAPPGDDSCRVFVRDVAYTGGGKGDTPAGSFAECCRRCRAPGCQPSLPATPPKARPTRTSGSARAKRQPA